MVGGEKSISLLSSPFISSLLSTSCIGSYGFTIQILGVTLFSTQQTHVRVLLFYDPFSVVLSSCLVKLLKGVEIQKPGIEQTLFIAF
jgi:hypothetical protein